MALSGEATMQLWHRLRRWRSETRGKQVLDVGEVFYRLAWWQRALLVIGCLAIIYKFQAPVFAMNVGPHLAKLWNADGSFNHAEWSIVENQSAGVFTLAIGALLIGLPQLNIVQRALIIPAMVMAFWMNAGNGTETQTMAHDARNSTTIKHNARIETLTQQVADNTTAWQAATKPPKRTTQAMVDFATKAEKDLDKRAHDECNQGTFGYTRGPKCGSLEAQHTAKLEELSRIQADKDATDFLTGIEAAISSGKAELKELGPKVEHADSLSVWTDFLASLHVLTAEQAKTLTEFKPVTDTIGAEAFASCMTIPSLIGWFWLFGLFTCHRGEAERRVLEVAKVVAADHASRAATVANQNDKPVHDIACAVDTVEAEIFEPDHAAALGIEGEDLPAFADSPRNGYEAMAAASLKADKTRKPRRASKLTPSHDSSVVLWAKERTFPSPGRHLWSDVATPDYRTWCESRNLEPVSPQRFGIVMRREVLTDKENGAERKGGKTKYLGLGLNAAGLKVVAGGRA